MSWTRRAFVRTCAVFVALVAISIVIGGGTVNWFAVTLAIATYVVLNLPTDTGEPS